ncbi:MAG: hypothetical protein OXH57_02930, partial [Ekhidna sp.]|nr:hypothetical protein [Ekhidna sp.]
MTTSEQPFSRHTLIEHLFREYQTNKDAFTVLADQLPVMVAVSTVESYDYRFANQAFAAAFGQEKEAIIAKGFEHTVRPLIHPKNWEVIRQYLPGFKYYHCHN